MDENRRKDGRTEEEVERLEQARISMEEKIKRYHQQENERKLQERAIAGRESQSNGTQSIRSIDRIRERNIKRENDLIRKKKTTITIVIIIAVVVILPILLGILSKRNTTIESEKPVEEVSVDPVQQARNDVINKWKASAGEPGTSKYIEDIYKQYPNDEVISNIYFYSQSKEWYDHYKSIGTDSYLDDAIEYANNIDPNYNGELSSEIKSFTSSLYSSQGLSNDDKTREEAHEESKTKTDKYNDLTNAEKKEICEYIQSRYDYYDSLEGGNSGDKYSDAIWDEAANKYGLTESQISIIWMNYYSY